MSRLARILETVAPRFALQREIARRDLATVKSWSGSAYASGNTNNRLRGHAAFGRSQMADEEASVGCYGFDAMRLEAMDLYRNNPIARGIVETARRYIRHSRARANTAATLELMGAGVAEIDAAAQWDNEATDWFAGYFWNRADALRRPGMTFGTLQDLLVTMQFVQGDCAFIRTGDGWLGVEGIQIRTPSKLSGDKAIRHGFRYNGNGIATHMYVCEYDRGYISEQSFQRIPMSSVVFCPWFWRAAQFRGVPRLHGVIDSLRDQEETHEATKQKVKNEAMLLSIERSGSRKKAPGSSLTMDDGTQVTTEKATYGMRFKTSGKPGEDFMFAKGDSPNAQYVSFMEYDSKIISTGAGIPYKILMSLYDGSWSANKAAQSALKVYINELWTNRRDVFTQRIWNAEIADAIRRGDLPPAPVSPRGVSLFNATEWTRPYFPQLDQEKEEKGRRSAFQNLTASLDDFADEQGTSAEALLRSHKRNIRQLQKDAAECGVPFELYAGPLLAGATSISASPEGEQEAKEITDEAEDSTDESETAEPSTEGNKWLR
jgi:capsid protein